MADVQTARWGKLLQAAFNLKQRLTLGQALPDVFPTYSLEHRSPEMEIQAGMDLCRGYATQVAVAAEYPGVLLANPANSGKVVIIDRAVVTMSVNSAFYIAMGGAGSNASAGQHSFCDWRRALQGRPTARCQTLSGAGSVAAVAMWAQNALGTSGNVVEGPIVLTQGGSVWFQGAALNQTLQVTFQWRERVLDQGETLL